MGDNDKEIFDKLNRQGETLARIDERTERMDREWKDSRTDHEVRIRKLELDSAKLKGISATIGAVATLAMNGIVTLIKHLSGSN